jgi:predicted metalloprotease with PDZ domain
MKLSYLVEIPEPHTHIVKVTLKGEKNSQDMLQIFMPSWSPGSYLMREYARNVRNFKATNEKGEYLFFEQKAKGIWDIDWSKSEIKHKSNHFEISYELYCHELTVRTSHVDDSHAFLHGPSVFMGVLGEEMKKTNCGI